MKTRPIILTLIFACFAVFFYLQQTYGFQKAWRLLLAPDMPPIAEGVPHNVRFADMRIITAGIERAAQGHNPFISNPGEPWERQFNYPRIWLLLSEFGVNVSHTDTLALLVIFCYFAGVLIFVPAKTDKRTLLLICLVVFSPATTFAIERGNTDLFMFFLLSLSLFFLHRVKAGAVIFSAVFLALAAVLKVFPIFAAAMYLREHKRKCLMLLVLLGSLFVGYMMLLRPDIPYMREATFYGWFHSYGRKALIYFSDFVYKYDATFQQLPLTWTYALWATLPIAVLMSGILRKFVKFDGIEQPPSRDLSAFRIGSAIYIGTYIFMRSNWDYRCVFMLFMIPQVVAWMRGSVRSVAWIARMTCAGILMNCWSTGIEMLIWFKLLVERPWTERHIVNFTITEPFNWLTLYGLIFLFIGSLPAWIAWRKPVLASNASNERAE